MKRPSSLFVPACLTTLTAALALSSSPWTGSAQAEPAAPPSPSATASASAPPTERATPLAEYAWPTTPSEEPKDDEWASATTLEGVNTQVQSVSWRPPLSLGCSQIAVREWVRISCTPPTNGLEEAFVGVVWGMAGDLSSTKAFFLLAYELDRYKAPPQNGMEELTRKMGASATITFPVRPGSAELLSLDRIGWDETYDGASVFSQSGMLIDVSWALGEKSPTILYR
jgi:hypothetical protein